MRKICTNLKPLKKSGIRTQDNYNGKAGEQYELDIMAKCGYCEQCRNEKSNNWVVRNYYESKGHEKMCFITLTYKENPYFLIKKDGQKFLKRLRRYLDYHEHGNKIRFFLAGEYGARTHRPHYHLIIYGWQDDNAKFIGYNKKDNKIYYSEIIDKCWGLGITSYQNFDKHEIPYVTLYESARERESLEYRTSREALKRLLNKLKEKNQDKTIRRAIIRNIEDMIKETIKNKENFYNVKEYNTWSKAIGWQEFEKQYNENYIFDEYIEDKTFHTPDSWVKKLANMGSANAIIEMLRRAQDVSELSKDQQREQGKNRQFDKERKKLAKKLNDKEKEQEL